VLTGSLVLFGLLMKLQVGFVPALIVLIIGCSLAHKGMHLKETVLLAVCLTSASVAIFIFGLGLSYRLFWWSN
jgi:hypothetical protein